MFDHLDDPNPPSDPGHLRPGVARRVTRRRRRRGVVGGVVVLLAALGAGSVVVADRAGPERVDVAGLAPEEPTAGEPVTVLFVGLDGPRGGDVEPRADTVVVARVDPEEGSVGLLSVPRDLVIPEDGDGSHRISGVGRDPAALISVLDEGLGISVDRYVETDPSGAAAIVDALGGLRLSVNAAVRAPSTGLALAAGCQTLDGEQVVALGRARRDLQVAGSDGRWRADPTGDHGRRVRAEVVVAALLRAVGRVDAGDLPGLVAEGLDRVTVDSRTSASEIVRIGRSTRDASGTSHWLPTEEATRGGVAVLVPAAGAADVVEAHRSGRWPSSSGGPIPDSGPPEITGLTPC